MSDVEPQPIPPGRRREGGALAARIFLFVGWYWSLFALGVFLFGGTVQANQSLGLGAAIAATFLTRKLTLDRRGIGLAVSAARMARDAVAGLVLAAVIVGGGDFAIDSTTALQHGYEGRFPAAEVVFYYLPAAAHEELLFRGYVFQRLADWSPAVAVVVLPALFAAAHLNNPAVSNLGLLNVGLAGVLLSLAWLWRRSLWMPISLHFFWNVLIGPILGYRVSGLEAPESVMTTPILPPVLITGGGFGIEGSVWITVGEAAAIMFLLYKVTRESRRKASAERAIALTAPTESQETQ